MICVKQKKFVVFFYENFFKATQYSQSPYEEGINFIMLLLPYHHKFNCILFGNIVADSNSFD